MRIVPSAATIMISCVLAIQTAVWGQGVDRPVSSGMFGPRTLGGGITPGTRTFGRGASHRGTTIGSMGRVGPISSIDPAPGGDQRPGQFVGADSSHILDFTGALGPGRGGRNRANIRSSLGVAFDYPGTVPARVGTALARRLEQSKWVQTLSAIEVHVQDDTATLRGVVATQRDRDLAGRLARLEAGIWHVINELVVAQVPAEPEPSVAGEPTAAVKSAADGSIGSTIPHKSAVDLPAELAAPSNPTLQPADGNPSGAD